MQCKKLCSLVKSSLANIMSFSITENILCSYLQLLEMQLDNKADRRADALAEDMMEEIGTKIDKGFIEVHGRLQTYFQQYV